MIKFVKRTDFIATLVRNSLIQILWWIFFFPGFFSTDSFSAVEMAKSGDLGNSFTASWALYVRIFSFHGNAIALLTLLNGLALVYSVSRLGYALFSNRTAAVSTLLLTLTPLISGMGITLWHDILMNAGIILATSFFINCQRKSDDIKRLLIYELIPGAFLISFRPNGLPTIVLFAIMYGLFIFKKNRFQLITMVKSLMALILLTTLVTITSSNIILGLSPINSTFAKQWMQFDISCYASTTSGEGFVERYIPDIGTTATWKSDDACDFISTAKLSPRDSILAEKHILRAWFQILKNDPLFILETHLARHAYLIPLPIFGVPKVPFLHSTIELKNQGIEWKFPTIANELRVFMRAWNFTRGITAWAGFWLLLIVLISQFGPHKELAPLILMAVALVLILFVVAPIPDGRYVMFVLISGQLLLIGNLVQILAKSPRANST